MKLTVNGKSHEIDVEPEMPLLWVLRDELNLPGTKFGCGMALLRRCTVHINGQPGSLLRHAHFHRGGEERDDHRRPFPRQTAIHRAARPGWKRMLPQCGYCQSGQIMTAAGLLKKNRASHRRRHR